MLRGLAASFVLAVIGLVLVYCSGFTGDDRCQTGDTAPCDTACGLGTMTCHGDGSWGPCEFPGDVECLPGDYGSCDEHPDSPPGLWFCSDDCRVGPCRSLCMPVDENGDQTTHECQAQCGPGVARCLDDGTWGACLEYMIPECRPGEVERCEDEEAGHKRCSDECAFGACDEGAPCTAGEVSQCGRCASQVCLSDETWSSCVADEYAVCSPGETAACEAPCGPGERECGNDCMWSECMEIDPVPCHPGDHQMCPTTLYCGLAFRVCNQLCEWMDCIETGD